MCIPNRRLGRIIDPFALFYHGCIIKVHSLLIKGRLFQVRNTYFMAGVLNYVCFLFRIKILIIAVSGDAFAHRTYVKYEI